MWGNIQSTVIFSTVQVEKFLPLILLFFCLSVMAQGQKNHDVSILGDANDDGVVNVADIVVINNYILGQCFSKFNFTNADTNQDGTIDYKDIVITESLITGVAIIDTYRISDEELNGWDSGVYYMDMLDENNSFYIVSRLDFENGTRIVYLNNFKIEDITQSMVLVFSPNDVIHDIFIAGYQFEAYSEEEYVTFIAYDKEGCVIDTFDVPYEDIPEIASSRAKSTTRKIEHYRILDIRNFLGKAGKTIWKVADTGVKLEDGKYADILKDFLIGNVAGIFTKAFLGNITFAWLIDLYLKQLYENNKNWFMGNAGIEITSIRRMNKSTINVEGVINNVSSIPSTRLVASKYPNYIDGKLGYLKKVPNFVLYGVAEGKSGQPGLYLHDKCTTPIIVSESNFTCTLPIEHKPGQTLFFRPFLVPDAHYDESADFGQTIGNMVSSNVRYGNRKEYTDQNPTCSTGSVISVSTNSAVVKCTYNGAEGFECGVMAKSESETMYVPTSSEDGERSISLTDLSPSTTYTYCAYIDMDDKPIHGAYYSFTTKDEEELCLDDNHPHWIDMGLPSGTQWRCCNEGASSPEEYGGYYTFGTVASAPSLDQIKEFLDYTTSVWTTQNGVNGRKFTGSNGGTIFLPAAGRPIAHAPYGHEMGGVYWSSTPLEVEGDAYRWAFDSRSADWMQDCCVNRRSVRPVR